MKEAGVTRFFHEEALSHIRFTSSSRRFSKRNR